MFKNARRDDPQEIALTITAESFFRILLLIIGTIIVLACLKKASHAFLLIFIAFFLTLALNAPVHWLASRLPGKRRGSRAIATTLSFLTVVILLGLFIASLVPPLVKQTKNFVNAAPNFVQEVKGQDSGVGKFIHEHHLQDQVDDFSSQIGDWLKHTGSRAGSAVTAITSSAISVLTILVLTFMMLVEGPRWVDFVRQLIPERHRARADRLSNDIYRVIRGYVNGQVLLALIASILISPMLFILHINYPVALMVVVFICGLIPMVGHTIGAIIVTLVALFHSLPSAIIILAYYILYQQIENYLVQPRLQANTTNMSPLLVFISVVVGVSFGGIVGGLVAIPVGGSIRVVLLDYLRTRKLVGAPVIKEEIKEAKI
jgi:predicted PurR-regulated permease PerM